MSPTCSSRFLVGRKTRSAAALTNEQHSSRGIYSVPPRKHALGNEAYGMYEPPARGNRRPALGERERVRPARKAAREWYVRRALEGRRIGTIALVGVAVLAGCGGGERQDANEPSGDFPVE